MSSYAEGQVHQLVDRLEAEGFTPGHITALGQYPRIADFKLVLDGDAEIVLKPKLLAKPKPFHCLISSGKKLTISACKGKRTIAKAKVVFCGCIDSDFVNHGLDVEGVATPDTDVEVHEIISDGQFADILNGVGVDLDKLVLTQDQIISFVETHKEWLRTGGYGTFFLMKNDNEFFVVRVDICSDGLDVDVLRLSFDRVWFGVGRHRFVLPQLTPGT